MKNNYPENQFELLRRMLNCNKTQLAERLGVKRLTLYRWENGETTESTAPKMAELFRTIMAKIDADHLKSHKQSE